MRMATSQTIAQPCPTKVFRVPTEWNCSCKKVMDQWWMGCLSSRGNKNRGFWPCFGLIPTLKHHPQTPGPLGPPGSVFARPTLQTAGPAVVATGLAESLGGSEARSPGTMWALLWSSWRVNHKGCCGCCLDGFLFQVLVPTSQSGWISWGKYNLKLSIGRWCQVDVDVRSKCRWQSRQPHDYFP